MLFCRDQNTGEQLRVQDADLSIEQGTIRDKNHPHSSRSKARGGPAAQNADITRGDLVFIKSEGDKNKSRDIYLVMDIQNAMAVLQKLNGPKFQSHRYNVPLNNIYPAVMPSCKLPTAPSDHTSIAVSSLSDEEDEEEDTPPAHVPTVPNTSSGTHPLSAGGLRRTTRISNPPERFGEWVP